MGVVRLTFLVVERGPVGGQVGKPARPLPPRQRLWSGVEVQRLPARAAVVAVELPSCAQIAVLLLF